MRISKQEQHRKTPCFLSLSNMECEDREDEFEMGSNSLKMSWTQQVQHRFIRQWSQNLLGCMDMKEARHIGAIKMN